METSSELEIGSLFDERFLVQARLGKGGSGTVYKALQEQLNRTVALKIMLPELLAEDENLQRFLQEGQTLCRLSHDNILLAYNFSVSQDGFPYLVMDYVEGYVLDEQISVNGALDPQRAVGIFRQICDGLAYAHSQGIIHRDLKPQNVMLFSKGDINDLAKILDFGFARLLPASGLTKETLTATGSVFGTPLFMSPEQWHSSKVDERSDIYSFGCLMYFVLTGVTPLELDLVLDNAYEGKSHKAEPLSRTKTRKRISAQLEKIIFKCISLNREERFQNVTELKAAIEQTPEYFQSEGLGRAGATRRVARDLD